MIFAILGLGEAGGRFARDLIAAGANVRGWDPRPRDLPEGLQFATSNRTAVRGANIIFSVNWASVAVEVATEVAPALTAEQLYVDFNTASPGNKRSVDQIVTEANGRFVDGALMGPIPKRGIRTATYVSGQGADAFAAVMAPYEMPVTVVSDRAGDAAIHKLIRSIMYKGVAAVVYECVAAAEHLGMTDYARQQMMTILQDESMIDRFVTGSRKHATRRMHEMEAVVELLEEVGVASFASQAAVYHLDQLRETDES